MSKTFQNFPMVPQSTQDTLQWLIQVDDLDTARSLAETVFRMLPREDPSSWDFISYYRNKSKFYKAAAEASLETMRLLPNSPEAKFNAAKCFHAAGDPFVAERLMQQVVDARPEWIDPKIDLAVYVAMQGRFNEGESLLEKLLEQTPVADPNHEVVDFNLGWHDIRHGRFKQGMRRLAHGRKLWSWGTYDNSISKPKLTRDTNVSGKTVLILGEAGAGDEMINLRFAQTLADRGACVIWAPKLPLLSLFSRTPGVHRFAQHDEALQSHFDYWLPCMDLTTTLDVDLHEIPNHPYITPDPAHVRKWQQVIPELRTQPKPLRIGLRWRGNPRYEQDLGRTVTPSLLESLSEIPGIELYSLQLEGGAKDLSRDSRVIDLEPLLTSWEDTAAAISRMDWVISSCTSVAHLAAAMGKSTAIMCPLNCYYIWATPGDRSPWYPSVRLFRQTRFKSWEEPFFNLRKMFQDLARSAGPSRALSSEISL